MEYADFVRTDDDLIELWRQLMGDGGFGTSTLWTIFIGDDGLVSRVIVPIDDLPVMPDGVDVVQNVFVDMLDEQQLASAAFLLSRPGPSHMTESDRAWARALLAADDRRLTEWPVHLATQGRVRVFAPDDLLRSA